MVLLEHTHARFPSVFTVTYTRILRSDDFSLVKQQENILMIENMGKNSIFEVEQYQAMKNGALNLSSMPLFHVEWTSLDEI